MYVGLRRRHVHRNVRSVLRSVATTNCVCGGYSGPGQTIALPEAGVPLVWECVAVSCSVCGPGPVGDAASTNDGGGVRKEPACPDASTIAPATPCTSTYAGVMCWGMASTCPCGGPMMTDCTCGEFDGSSNQLEWACDTVSCNNLCGDGGGTDAASTRDAAKDAAKDAGTARDAGLARDATRDAARDAGAGSGSGG